MEAEMLEEKPAHTNFTTGNSIFSGLEINLGHLR
jgi:hypothetical protein